jgi:hypothetical protein
MKEKEYEVTTHYKIGCDTVEIYDSGEMLECIEALHEKDEIVGLTINFTYFLYILLFLALRMRSRVS